ncbi:MAG: NADH-quinone oxidoreductase subunit NuoK [Deltaproteobacteria bacterium]|nr:NADH-quinone oxidoreductase subunit NuoK [Deltaproteobacteria bacterium]
MKQLALFPVGLEHFLLLGSALLALGVYCVLTRRNAVGILVGVELILNSANVNFVAFAHYVTGSIGGHVAALFIIVLAAAEAAIALAIVLSIYQSFSTIDATHADTMRG